MPRAVAGPHRLADADLGDRLDVLAGREVADAQLEPLRAVIVDQGREQLAVRADLKAPSRKYSLPSASAVSSKISCVVAAAPRACGTSRDIARLA